MGRLACRVLVTVGWVEEGQQLGVGGIRAKTSLCSSSVQCGLTRRGQLRLAVCGWFLGRWMFVGVVGVVGGGKYVGQDRNRR